MAEETSSLVESAEQAAPAEEAKVFDAAAFLSDDVIEETKANYDEGKAEALDAKDEASNEGDENYDGFAWDSIETEKQEEEVREPEENWDETVFSDKAEAEGDEESGEVDWERVAKALGKKASSKEEFEALFDTPFAPKTPETDQMRQVKDFLSLSDRELLIEEMKADGMDEDDVLDTIEKMEGMGSLKREAFKVRKQLNQFLEQQKAKAIADAANEDKTRKERVAQNKIELQNHLKEMKSFMGGRVKKEELQDAYKYIVSGKMAEDIWKGHGNAAEVAMFMLFKDKFSKILVNQGREAGKAGILDSISSPELRSGSKSNYVPKRGGFDPAEFMKE